MRTNIEEQNAAARFRLLRDASARERSRHLAGKIEDSGKYHYQRQKTAAIHALRAELGRGKNEHGKALRLPRERAHQNQRMFGSQEQESGRSPASNNLNLAD